MTQPATDIARSGGSALRREPEPSVRRVLDRGAGWLLFGVVAFAPLPFGLTAPLPIALACTGLALSLAFADPSRLLPAHRARIAPALLAFGLYVCAALLQMSPRVAALVGPAPIWAELAASGQHPTPLLSWTTRGPWFGLGAALALVLALVSAAILCVDRVRATSLLKLIAISGSLYALYGIAAHLIDPGALLWREKTAYLDAVTGPFVNRNTAATYWGSCAIVCMALALAELDERGRPRQRRRVLCAWLLALAICLVATAMTGSRAGGVLTIAALALCGGLWLAGGPFRGRALWVISGLGAVGLLVVAQVLGGLIGGRVREYGIFDQRRAEAYADTWRMVMEHPWFGIGLGNFASVFPRYRSDQLGSSGIWDRAHSAPLELAAELGLPITIAIAICCFSMVYALLKGCFHRRRDRTIPIASVGVAALGGLHSSVDFSVQIAGYAVVFGAVVGCGLAQSVSTRLGPGRAMAATVAAE